MRNGDSDGSEVVAALWTAVRCMFPGYNHSNDPRSHDPQIQEGTDARRQGNLESCRVSVPVAWFRFGARLTCQHTLGEHPLASSSGCRGASPCQKVLDDRQVTGGSRAHRPGTDGPLTPDVPLSAAALHHRASPKADPTDSHCYCTWPTPHLTLRAVPPPTPPNEPQLSGTTHHLPSLLTRRGRRSTMETLSRC